MLSRCRVQIRHLLATTSAPSLSSPLLSTCSRILPRAMENYIVLEHIGEGSFGKVYKARRKNTGFTVAMKFITKHGKSEKDIRNLRQEIGILRKLNHENIILMFDAFETDREFCVVTEYAQGELFDILQDDQRLPESTVQQIAKQLVKALHYLSVLFQHFSELSK